MMATPIIRDESTPIYDSVAKDLGWDPIKDGFMNSPKEKAHRAAQRRTSRPKPTKQSK